VFPWVKQQRLDGGLCVLAGTWACGWSLLLESKRRRREMALFVAPRALCVSVFSHSVLFP
jgi:hypothetical protein